MSSQKEEVQKSAGFDVGAHAAQSTHSVCLFRVFFVHFVYLLGRFSDVNIGYKPPPPPLQACIIHKHGHFFVFSPLCHILCHDFLLFSMLLYFFFFLHTYPYKHVHMLCVCFFKLPHSFDVSHISLLLFGMKVGLQASPEAQLSYQKRELDVFLQYVLP